MCYYIHNALGIAVSACLINILLPVLYGDRGFLVSDKEDHHIDCSAVNIKV